MCQFLLSTMNECHPRTVATPNCSLLLYVEAQIDTESQTLNKCWAQRDPADVKILGIGGLKFDNQGT